MRPYRLEVWTLAVIFADCESCPCVWHIAEEVVEGDATKFDQTILLFFRNADDLSDPIGTPWVEEMARDIPPWAVTPFSAS